MGTSSIPQIETISILTKPEHILHVEEPCFMTGDPACRPYRPLREGESARCLVRDLNPFAFGGKPDAVFTHDIAGTDGLETNSVTLPGSRVPLAPIDGDIPKIPA